MVRELARLSSIVLLAWCGCFSMPQTAAEFREAVPGSLSAKHRSYEVERSYAAISEELSRRSDECLNVSVEVSSVGYRSASHWTDHYKPTVVVADGRTELYLQQHKVQGNLIKPHKEPEGGYYMLVVDVGRLSRDHVKVDMYAPRIGYDHLVDAVDGWIRGTSSLCPDLAENDF
jgi:hypothetical protein